MKAPLIAALLAVAALMEFPSAPPQTGPLPIAEYRDAESGERFELFQAPDGSLFCVVERANGILTRLDVRPEGIPDLGTHTVRGRIEGWRMAPKRLTGQTKKRVSSQDQETIDFSSDQRTVSFSVLKGLEEPSILPLELYGDIKKHPCYPPEDSKKPKRATPVGLILLLTLGGCHEEGAVY